MRPRRLPRSPALARFLIARLFYTDGLNTLFAFGAIFAAGAFSMTVDEVILRSYHDRTNLEAAMLAHVAGEDDDS